MTGMPKAKNTLVINGQAVATANAFPVLNPTTGDIVGYAPDAEPEHIDQALQSADAAFKVWSMWTPRERSQVIQEYARLLEGRREELIDLLMAETGKPRDNAEYDFDMLPNCLRFFDAEAARLEQPTIPDPDGNFLNYILRQPLGVVVGYLAWNFPILNFGYKVGPVLASGCTAIIKPSAETPLTTLRCAEIAAEAGIPNGVINVLSCSDHETTGPLLTSEVPAMFTMIGSTRAGVAAMKTALTNVKHFSVELGGNAPVIVYADADIEAAADSIVGLKFGNTGQVCVSPNRCFVHESVYESFLAACREKAASISLHPGDGSGQMMGPMINDRERQRVIGLIDAAVADGATLECGGQVPADRDRGSYLEPTILSGVKQDMSVAKEEIFGPVLPVLVFNDQDEVTELANETEFGLAAYVYTSNLSAGLKAAASIQAGSVCVNAVHYDVSLPHGGVKQSGVGKDCSKYSLEEYMTLKRVSVHLGV